MKKSFFYCLLLMLALMTITTENIVAQEVEAETPVETEESNTLSCEDSTTVTYTVAGNHSYRFTHVQTEGRWYIGDSLKMEKDMLDRIAKKLNFSCDNSDCPFPDEEDCQPYVITADTMRFLKTEPGFSKYTIEAGTTITFGWYCSDCDQSIPGDKEPKEEEDEKDSDSEKRQSLLSASEGNPSILQILPNPSDGLFNFSLDLPAVGQARIEITAIDGRIIYSKKLDQDSATNFQTLVNLADQPAGIYFATLYTNQSILATEKIIIQK